MYTVQQPDPNYVVNVLWTVTGVDGEYTSSVTVNTMLSSQQVGTFIPYDQLTEEIVLGWIPAEQLTSAQNTVQEAINYQINPPAVPQNVPLPWA